MMGPLWRWWVVVWVLALASRASQAEEASDGTHAAPRRRPPSVLMVVMDDLRASMTDETGRELLRHPHLNRLAARPGSTSFSRAFA